MNCRRTSIKTIENDSGVLSFFEGERDLPFAINHFACLGAPSDGKEDRYVEDNTNQLMAFCPRGCVEITAGNDGEKQIYRLDHPSVGIVIENGMWDRVDWVQEDSVLCAASSNGIKRGGCDE